eukprot:1143202-Pelagomonas_calceolata.AAC.6
MPAGFWPCPSPHELEMKHSIINRGGAQLKGCHHAVFSTPSAAVMLLRIPCASYQFHALFTSCSMR